MTELEFRERLTGVADAVKSHAMQCGPMQWGVDDCLLIFADHLRPVLGVDVAQRFRGKYRSEFGARRLLKSFGYDSIADAVAWQARRFGWASMPNSDVEPGDIGVVALNRTQSCAMMHRSGLWVARAANGYAAVHHSACVVAFRVPDV